MENVRHVYSHDKKYCLSTYYVPSTIGGTEETRKQDRQSLCSQGAYTQVKAEQKVIRMKIK